MRALVTSSRLPAGIETIRKLGRAGHTVFASDTFRSAPGSHSKFVEERFVTAKPTYETERFLQDIDGILRRNRIDLLVPTFEEVFFIARARERFPSFASLFAPSFETLRRLHDKERFLALGRELSLSVPTTLIARSRDELAAATRELPRYFARAAFSRGGVTLFTNEGPLAGEVSLADCDPTPENPFLVQPFVEGRDVCTFSVLHQGRVAAHLTYVHPLMVEHAGGIVLETVVMEETLEATRKIAEATGYTGMLGLDFLETARGLSLVEANPRPTAGVSVMPDQMFDDALLNRQPNRTLVAPAGERSHMSLALIRNLAHDWRHDRRAAKKDLEELASDTRDVFAAPGDVFPLLYQLLAYSHVLGYQMRNGKTSRTDLMQGYFYDICWDGDAPARAPNRVVAGRSAGGTSTP